MEKKETYIYSKDLEEMVNLYRSVKYMIDDIIDSLKFIIIIFAILLWVYVLSNVVEVIDSLNIIPNTFVGLVYILLAASGSLYILLKMKDL